MLKTPQKRPPQGAGLDPAGLDACRVTPARTQAEAARAARSRPLSTSPSQSSGWSGRGIGVRSSDLTAGHEPTLFPEPEPRTLVLPGLPDLDRVERARLELELLGMCVRDHPVTLFPCPADERLARSFGRAGSPVSGRFHSSTRPTTPNHHGGPHAGAEHVHQSLPPASPVSPHDLRPVNPTPCGHLARYPAGRITLRGWPAATRKVRTAEGHMMRFLTLEDESGLAEVVLFPEVYRRDGHRLAEAGVLCLTGIVQDQHGSYTLEAERVW